MVQLPPRCPGFPAGDAVGLFCGALAIRLALLLTTADDPVFATPMLDAEYAVDWAHGLAGNGFLWSPEGTAYFRTPLYAWFLAAAFALPGPDLAAARIVQAILGALTAVLLARVSGHRFGRVAAWGTGILAAFAWPLLLFGRELLIASVSVFLGAAVLALWDRADERSGAGRWLALGLVIGLAAIARPNSLAYLPAALVLAWLGPGRRGDWRRPALLLVGSVLIVAPITVRNHRVSGDPILLSSQGGINLWIGNHPEADGMSAVLPGFSSWRNEDVEAHLASELGHRPGPAEQDDHFRRLAVRAMLDDPLRTIRLFGKKTWLFLQGYEIRNNRDLYDLRGRSAILGAPLPDFGVVLPLALIGLIAFRSRARELSFLLAHLAANAIAVVLFFVCARYRLAAWPALLVFAGAGASRLLDSGLAGRRRLGLVAGLTLFVLAARFDPIGVRTPDAAQPRFQVGNVHARLEDWDRAEHEYRRALEITPDFPEAMHHLGGIYLRQDRPGEALPHLLLAAQRMPRSFRARRTLAEALEALGRPEDAVVVRREAVELSAGSVTDRAALAGALGMGGRFEEATEIYAELAREGVDDPWLDLNAGQTALALGRADEGLARLARAARNDETRRAAEIALVRWHLAQREPEAAIATLEEAVRREPDALDLRRLRALARWTTGDRAGAAEDLERILTLDPYDAESRRRLDEIRRDPIEERR